MAKNNLFSYGLITSVIAILAVTLGSKIEADDCSYCTNEGIYGLVTLKNGDPAPDGTTVTFKCTSSCAGFIETCTINSGTGRYENTPGDCGFPITGTFDVWAELDVAGCIHTSQVEIAIWTSGQFQVNTLVLDSLGYPGCM